MQAAPLTVHQRIVGRLFRKFGDYLDGKTCEAFISPFSVRLFEKQDDKPEDVDTIVAPDICVVCDSSKIDLHGCKGAPDLIVEVLSPSTQRHDRLVKYNLYQQAGVREYWIVSPEERVAQVFLLGEHRFYVPVDLGTAKDTLKVNVLEDCVVDLGDVFPEAPKE